MVFFTLRMPTISSRFRRKLWYFTNSWYFPTKRGSLIPISSCIILLSLYLSARHRSHSRTVLRCSGFPPKHGAGTERPMSAQKILMETKRKEKRLGRQSASVSFCSSSLWRLGYWPFVDHPHAFLHFWVPRIYRLYFHAIAPSPRWRELRQSISTVLLPPAYKVSQI